MKFRNRRSTVALRGGSYRLRRAQARVYNRGVCYAVEPGKTASILVFSVAALNDVAMELLTQAFFAAMRVSRFDSAVIMMNCVCECSVPFSVTRRSHQTVIGSMFQSEIS